MPRRPQPRRARGHATTTRGPRYLAGRLGLPRQPSAAPPMPADFAAQYPGASGLEWAIFWAHTRLGKLQHVTFDYQTSFQGGRTQFGGIVLDFIELDVPIAINAEGTYWHYERGTAQVMRDWQARATVALYGVQLIFIDEAYGLDDPVSAVRDALRGIDRSRKGPER